MNADRLEAAEKALGRYEFGDGLIVSAQADWQELAIANEMSRILKLSGDASAGAAPVTLRARFTVCFAPGTAEVVDSFAVDEKGVSVGSNFPNTQVGLF